MVSIKDIAKRAGVSISTVSYALNGSDRITEETATRIQAIAREMNYVPHAAARSLKRKQSMLIGLFLTDFSGHFYGNLLQGVKEELARRGYDLIVCSGRQSHRMIPERTFDGAIVIDSTFSDAQLLEYAERGHKLVVLDRELPLPHPNVNQVLLDNKAGATLAMEHLIALGHDTVYAVGGPAGSFDAGQRMRAVRQAAEREPRLRLIEVPGNFDKRSGEAAGRLIAEAYDGPAGVFCLNDEMAVGLLDYVQTHTGLVVGEHLHLVGFDNIELARYVQPRLTTVDYSMYKWGALAAEQLLKMLADEPVEHERVYVTLLQGSSAKPAQPGRS